MYLRPDRIYAFGAETGVQNENLATEMPTFKCGKGFYARPFSSFCVQGWVYVPTLLSLILKA